MLYKPNTAYYKVFTTTNPITGAACNADSTPTAVANKNGVDDPLFTLTVVNIDVGRYKISGLVPATYEAGDVVNVSITATVVEIVTKAVVETFLVDTKIISDIPTAIQVRQELDASSSKLANLDATVSSRSTFAGGPVLSVTNPVTVGTNNDKADYTLSELGAIGIWNTLLADARILVNSFGAKLKLVGLGSDNKVLISADEQDLSTTLKVNAKVVEDKVGYSLASVSVTAPDLGMTGKGGAMGAATLDMTLEQGADFSRRVVYKVAGTPVDLTGYTGRGQIRPKPGSTTLTASFSIVFEVPRSSGAFTIELSAADSSAMVVGSAANSNANRLYYDIELVTPASKVIRVLQGRLIVSPEVTK